MKIQPKNISDGGPTKSDREGPLAQCIGRIVRSSPPETEQLAKNKAEYEQIEKHWIERQYWYRQSTNDYK